MNLPFQKLKRPENRLSGTDNGIRKKRIIRVGLFFLTLLLIAGGAFVWKTGMVLDRVAGGDANIFKSLVKTLPGVEKKLQGEDEGRINILLLGMRGAGFDGGGLLTDTIMVLSIHPKDGDADVSKASLVSIPRDLYVKVPNRSEHRKINAVYALGEERSRNGGGLEDMRAVVSEVTGLSVPYAAIINFQGFQDLVDAVGGVTVHLDKPFEEGLQFRGLEKRCDGVRFVVPSGNYEEKRIQRKNGTYYDNPKRYPLCFERLTPGTADEFECGGNFKLPAGDVVLDGEKALCYARARYASSDFDRARRQQEIIKLIKEKALSVGTLTNFSKVSDILDSLGDNVSTNLEAWEMSRFLDLYQKVGDPGSINQRVLENSPEGLLYAPVQSPQTGYILLPIGDNYDRIHDLFRNSLNY